MQITFSRRRSTWRNCGEQPPLDQLRAWFLPWFPQPTDGQLGAVSPDRHAPFHRAPPSEPDHSLQDTSEKVPVKAPCPDTPRSDLTAGRSKHIKLDVPDGKNLAAPPVSSQMSKLKSSSSISTPSTTSKRVSLTGLACQTSLLFGRLFVGTTVRCLVRGTCL